jgi:hypothetical protein
MKNYWLNKLAIGDRIIVSSPSENPGSRSPLWRNQKGTVVRLQGKGCVICVIVEMDTYPLYWWDRSRTKRMTGPLCFYDWEVSKSA